MRWPSLPTINANAAAIGQLARVLLCQCPAEGTRGRTQHMGERRRDRALMSHIKLAQLVQFREVVSDFFVCRFELEHEQSKNRSVCGII